MALTIFTVDAMAIEAGAIAFICSFNLSTFQLASVSPLAAQILTIFFCFLLHFILPLEPHFHYGIGLERTVNYSSKYGPKPNKINIYDDMLLMLLWGNTLGYLIGGGSSLAPLGTSPTHSKEH